MQLPNYRKLWKAELKLQNRHFTTYFRMTEILLEECGRKTTDQKETEPCVTNEKFGDNRRLTVLDSTSFWPLTKEHLRIARRTVQGGHYRPDAADVQLKMDTSLERKAKMDGFSWQTGLGIWCSICSQYQVLLRNKSLCWSTYKLKPAVALELLGWNSNKYSHDCRTWSSHCQ